MFKQDANSRYNADDDLELGTGGPCITRNLAMTRHQLFLLQRALSVGLGEQDLRFSATELEHLRGIKNMFWDVAVDNTPTASTATHSLCI